MAKRGRKPTDETPPPPWAQRIARAREARGLSQDALAGLMEPGAQSSITDWERGKHEPNLTKFIKLGEVLKVPATWLAFGIHADGKPDNSDPVALAIVERHKDDRLFGRIFGLVAKMLAEEGLDSDLAYLVTYSKKIARTAQGRADDGETRELISRELEKDRLEIRKAMELVRKNRL